MSQQTKATALGLALQYAREARYIGMSGLSALQAGNGRVSMMAASDVVKIAQQFDAFLNAPRRKSR